MHNITSFLKSINYENEEGIYEGFNISVEFNIK